jgi:hypothetical protein
MWGAATTVWLSYDAHMLWTERGEVPDYLMTDPYHSALNIQYLMLISQNEKSTPVYLS